MEDKQKLHFLRLAVGGARDWAEASAYASFIIGNAQPFVTHTPKKSGKYEVIRPNIEDGVYIVEKGFLPVRLKDVAGVQSPKSCNVMVSYHEHKWIVAKKDISNKELQLLSDDSKCEESSPFYKSEIEALNDFDMESCTGHLRKAGLDFKLDADLCIPTAGQLAAMYLYREELNKALGLVGGAPMKEKVYWSSSEFDAFYSWLVNFNDGYVYYNGKCYSRYVRPCTAFKL